MAKNEVYDRWRRGVSSEARKQAATPIMKIEEGTTNIVILPLVATDDDMPYQISFTHKFQDGDDDVFLNCNQLTKAYETPCVACKAKSILLSTGDDDDAADAEVLKPYPRGWFLCGNVDSPSEPAQAVGFGLRTIEQDIGKLVDKYGSFWDPDNCQILTFERVGRKKKDTRYFGFALNDDQGTTLADIFGKDRAKKLLETRFPLTRVFPKADQNEVLEMVLSTIDWDSKRLGRLKCDPEPEKKSSSRDEEKKPSRRSSDDDEKEERSSKRSRDDDEDEKPARKKKDDDDEKPSRKAKDDDDDDDRSSRKSSKKGDDDEEEEKSSRKSKDDDDDEKPSRRKKDDDDDEKPARRASKKDDDDEDEKPARRSSKKEDDDDDEKPSRRSSKKEDDDDEPPRKTNGSGKSAKDGDDDEDPSPKRKPKPKGDDDDDDDKKKGKDEEGDAEVEEMIARRRRERQARRTAD